MSTLKTNNIQHVDRSDPSIIINTDGSVNIAGTMTYEDVTNVDAVGIITGRNNIDAQKQVLVGTGVSVKAGGINVTAGITTVQALQATTGTFSSDVSVGGNLAVDSGSNGMIDFGDITTAYGRLYADNSNGVLIGSKSNHNLVLRTNNTERARIDTSGRLLIDVTSTSLNNKLQIQAASDATSIAIFGRSADDISEVDFYENDKSTKLGEIQYRQDHANIRHRVGYLAFATGGVTERLRIDSSGLVHIATTSGNEKLNVAGAIRSSGSSANFSAGLEGTIVDYDTSNNLARLGHVSGASGSARDVVFLSGGAERLRIESGGGIKFPVVGNSIPVGGILHHTNNYLYMRGGTSGLILGNDDNTTTVQIYDGYIKFETTDGSERMRLTSTGRLGIGESTPLAQLHIKPPSNMSQLLLEQNNATDGYALFQDGPNGGHLKFMRHIGGSDTQRLLLRSGGGLCFGTDSAEANGLDDYEEGSWVPECRIETRNASDSPIDGVQGNYEKIGKFVHAYGQFILNGTPSERSTGRAIEIRNFPFSHGHNFDKISGDIRVTNWLTSSTYGQDCYFIMRMLNGQTYARVELIQLGYNGTRNASVVMQDNMYIIFSFTYPAT